MAQPGQLVPRTYAGEKSAGAAAVDDPQRVRALLPAGSTRRILVKGGFVGDVEAAGDDRSAGSLVYVFETRTLRTIESNDGRRIVELRHFESRKMIKLVTEAAGLSLDLGPPQAPLLDWLPDVTPQDDAVELPAADVADAILAADSRHARQLAASRALVRSGPLSGKRVRITYVDGVGVESVLPVDCTLADSELRLLFHAAVLPECYLFAETDPADRPRWRVDAGQLIDLMDPALAAIPCGKIEMRTLNPATGSGDDDPTCVAEIRQAEVHLMSTRQLCGRVGLFTPCGDFRRGGDGRLETATLQGTYHAMGVSQDYFLFDESLREAPLLEVSYACERIP